MKIIKALSGMALVAALLLFSACSVNEKQNGEIKTPSENIEAEQNESETVDEKDKTPSDSSDKSEAKDDIVKVFDLLGASAEESIDEVILQNRTTAEQFLDALKSKDKDAVAELIGLYDDKTGLDEIDKFNISSYELFPFIKGEREENDTNFYAVVKLTIDKSESNIMPSGTVYKVISTGTPFISAVNCFSDPDTAKSLFEYEIEGLETRFNYRSLINLLSDSYINLPVGKYTSSDLDFTYSHNLQHLYLFTYELPEGDTEAFDKFIEGAFPGNEKVVIEDAKYLTKEPHAHGGSNIYFTVRDVSSKDSITSFVCDFYYDFAYFIPAKTVSFTFKESDAPYPTLESFEVVNDFGLAPAVFSV